MLRAVFISILVSFYGNAQEYITISDPAFAAFLSEKYPSCFQANQLDVSCEAVKNEETLSLNGLHISNLEGIQYFVNLKSLECIENNLVEVPVLPAELTRLDCGMNQLKQLPQLPQSLEELSCAVNQLTALPVLPGSLKILYCNFNQITALPALPGSLEYLACGSNQIACLPEFPESIFIGDVALNPLNCVSAHAAWMDEESLKIPICTTGNTAGDNKCICITTTLVDKEENNEPDEFQSNSMMISIAPNPTKGNLTLRSDEMISHYCIRDIEGKIIVESKLIQKDLSESNQIDLDITELINGIYFVQTTAGTETTISKVIKAN